MRCDESPLPVTDTLVQHIAAKTLIDIGDAEITHPARAPLLSVRLLDQFS